MEIACKEVKINGKLIYYKLKLQHTQSNVNFVSDLLFNGLKSLYPDMLTHSTVGINCASVADQCL